MAQSNESLHSRSMPKDRHHGHDKDKQPSGNDRKNVVQTEMIKLSLALTKLIKIIASSAAELFTNPVALLLCTEARTSHDAPRKLHDPVG